MYDNEPAARSIDGLCLFRQDPDLCKLACALHRVCSSMYTISSTHVKSHFMHPWNEYADSICTYYDKHPQEAKVSWCPIAPVDSFSCYCIDIASAMLNEQVRQSLEADDLWTPYVQQALPSSIIASHIDNCNTSIDDRNIVMKSINIIQYNIRTFVDPDLRKVFFLKLRKDKIAIASLQETRETAQSIFVSHGYLCCKSGAKKGNHGCQICFSLNIPVLCVDDIDQHFTIDSLSIIDCSHRHIIVKFSHKHCVVYFVSFHAPYLGCKEDPVKWWKFLKSRLKIHCGQESHCLYM